MSVVQFANQDYATLSKTHTRDKLFTDDVFPPRKSSVWYSEGDHEEIEWKRPYELVKEPFLFVDNASFSDVIQGHLGNCWLVGALGALTCQKELLFNVVYEGDQQDRIMRDPRLYSGVFRFRFFRFGKWVEVVVDDLLPVNTSTGQLVFSRSKTGNEFWPCLLEKAYAKLNGSYEALDAGDTGDALVDFTAGILQVVETKSMDKTTSGLERTFEQLEEAFRKHGAVLCCWIAEGKDDSAIVTEEDGKNVEKHSKTSMGLVVGHAYGITSLCRVPHKGFLNWDSSDLIRLRNPWGEKEWNGPWSDGSEEWKAISDSKKKEIGLVNADDGDFWMSFADFASNYSKYVVCQHVNTSFLSFEKRWASYEFFDEWRGKSAGGCHNNKDTFLNNPQYLLHCNSDSAVMISLMQEDVRAQKSEGISNLSIGFEIFKVEDNYRDVRADNVDVLEPVHSQEFTNTRQVSTKIELKEGKYIIFPCTFEPKLEKRFLLRLFVDTLFSTAEQLTLLRPKNKTCQSPFVGTFRVCAVGASDLAAPNGLVIGDVKPIVELIATDYSSSCCRISKKYEKSRGMAVSENPKSPQWNSKHMFFIRTPNRAQVTATIWSKGLTVLADKFMGQATVDVATYADPAKVGQFWEVKVPLKPRAKSVDKSGKPTDTVAGEMTLRVRYDPISGV